MGDIFVNNIAFVDDVGDYFKQWGAYLNDVTPELAWTDAKRDVKNLVTDIHFYENIGGMLLTKKMTSSSFVSSATSTVQDFKYSVKYGGATFEEYKVSRGGGGLVGEIELNNPHPYYGTTFPVRIEYSHRWVTQAMQRKYELPNWIVNNRLNVMKTNTLYHSGHDLIRYRFLPKEIKLRLNDGGDLKFDMFGKRNK